MVPKIILLALGLMLSVGRGEEPTNVATSNAQTSVTTSASSLSDITKAANAGDPTAQFNLGLLYAKGDRVTKDSSAAAIWFRKAADQGNAQAQAFLGYCYHDGTGVEKDVVESVKWFRKAADQGDVGAQFILGLDYQYGTGVEKDDIQSANWYRKAADQGNALAERRLGFCYYNGTGVRKDLIESATWYRKAADQGDVRAVFILGLDYRDGEGVEKNAVEAAKLFRKAAEQGDSDAQRNVGLAYALGQGVKKDLTEANEWFLKSANQGDTTAQFNLGLSYAMGEGETKDTVAAASWYKKAAEQGNPQAQYHLGAVYSRGEGVAQDYGEALAWYIVSSSSGLEEATKERDRIERILGVQSTLMAQQRSKELLKEIDQSKAQAIQSKNETDRVTSDEPQGSGTGVFVSKDGLIITAAHVVKDAHAIKVLTQQGLKSAQVLKIDTSNDVALLKCEGQFQAVPIKSSSGVKLGQSVFTIGFPDTQLQGFSPKMTQGEISSLSGVQDDVRDWQISVPVQPGNSGGPLFDFHGNVIGLVVAKLDAVVTAQTTGALPENVNYAVKTAYVLPLLDADAANLLPETSSPDVPEKTEDVVGRVQNSVVLIFVY